MNRSLVMAKAMLVGLLCLLAVSYLAGYFLLLSWGVNPRSVTPLTLLSYAYYYSDDPDVSQRLIICAAVALALVGVSALVLLWPRPRALHGDARFATRQEIAAAGLLGETGIVLGRLGSRYLMLGGQQGVALAAPPRAGKGAGVVIPNALSWGGSMVCMDLKRENWTVTAGYRRAQGQACYLFEPFAEDGRSSRWNPLVYVSEDPAVRVSDLQRIAEMLFPDPTNTDPFWSASARSLFLGIALYLFETPSLPRTIGEALRQGMASDEEGFAHHWKRLIEGRNANGHPLSAECTRLISDVIDLAPLTASSIRKTFTSKLDLWLNPILDAATSGHDFDLRELRMTPQSIYVAVNPEDLHRLRPVLNLFFQQAIGLQTRELPEHNPKLKHQVLMMLDEFTALGRIPIIAESIAYLPGYNVRVVLVIQTPAQLREVYGPELAETMLKSLGARILFTPKDFADAREISDELGNQTVKARSVSKPLWDFSNANGKRGRSVSESDQRRALMLPQEVKELPAGSAIIFYEGLRPFLFQKIRYFLDPVLRKRVLSPPPRPDRLDVQPAPRIERTPRAAGGDVSTGMRIATQDDIGRIEQLELKDFGTDYRAVAAPRVANGEEISKQQVVDMANSFLSNVAVRA